MFGTIRGHPYPAAKPGVIEVGDSTANGLLGCNGYDPDSADYQMRSIASFGRHATLQQGAFWGYSENAYGKPPSVHLDGSDDYMSIPATFNQAGNWTVIVRLFTRTLNASAINWVVAMEDGANTGYGLLGIHTNFSGRLIANHYSGAGKLGDTSHLCIDNREYVIATTSDNSGNGEFFFRNATDPYIESAGTFTGTQDAANAGVLRLGIYKNDTLGATVDIISFQMYGRVLTLNELNDITRPDNIGFWNQTSTPLFSPAENITIAVPAGPVW